MEPSSGFLTAAAAETLRSANHERPAPSDSLVALAARAAGGDDEAFECIYRRLDGGLRRFFVRRGVSGAELGEELAQLTWVDVWMALRAGRYDSARAAVSTFVYAVGFKVWLQHRRRARQDGRRVEENGIGFALAVSQLADPADALALAERVERVRSVLHCGGAGLSEEELRLLRAVAGGGSERSLAQEFGVAASTINARKAIVLKKLQAHIEPAAERRGAPRG